MMTLPALLVNFGKKFPVFLTLFVFFGSTLLTTTEQLKRLGINPVAAITISIGISSVIGLLLFWFKYTDGQTLKSVTPNPEKASKKILLLGILVIYICIVGFPVFSGQVAFERSADSDLYHAQIIKSLLSLTDGYQLNHNNDNIVIYAATFVRVGESLVALTLMFLPFLTFLQAQFWCYLLLMVLSFFQLAKIWRSSTALVFLVVMLSVPMTFLQLHTNYIDLYVIPLFVIGTSSLLLAGNRTELLLALMWLALLAGLKLPVFLVTALFVLLFFIYKGVGARPVFLVTALLIFALPLAPLLVVNLVQEGTPVAPYAFLFWDGWDVMKTSFLENRPPMFQAEGILQASAVARFFYSHVNKAFMLVSFHDARLAGGGMIFLFTLAFYLVFSGKKIFQFIRNRKETGFSGFLTPFSVFLTAIVAGFLVIPETYLFRYIVIIFVMMIFYLFQELSKQNNTIQAVFLGFCLLISFSQFYLTKSAIMRLLHVPVTPANFFNFSYYYTSQGLNRAMKFLKANLGNTGRALIVNRRQSVLTGIYLSALPPYSKVRYRKYDPEENYDVGRLLDDYDCIIFVDKELKGLSQRYRNKGFYYFDGKNYSMTFIKR